MQWKPFIMDTAGPAKVSIFQVILYDNVSFEITAGCVDVDYAGVQTV